MSILTSFHIGTQKVKNFTMIISQVCVGCKLLLRDLTEGATWSTFSTDSHHSEYLLSGQIGKMIERGIAPNVTCHFEISLTHDLSF